MSEELIYIPWIQDNMLSCICPGWNVSFPLWSQNWEQCMFVYLIDEIFKA